MLQTIVDFGRVEPFGLSFTPRIYGYGLMLVLGFLSGIWLAHWRAKRMGENHEAVTVIGILSLVGGIIGARLAFVIQNFEDFAHSSKGPTGLFDVTSGGLIYYGGVILGTAMVMAYLLVKRLPVRRYLDIVAVSMMVGLAFGRAGCFLNGCCYGGRCSEDWPLATHFPMYSQPAVKLYERDNPFSSGMQGPSPVYAHQLEQRGIELHRRNTPDSYALATSESFEGLLNPHPKLIIDDKLAPATVAYELNGKKFRAPILRMVSPDVFSAEQIRLASASRSLAVRPAQALGLVNALLIATLLGVFFRHRGREGQVFALMLILYPITRFLLEDIRRDTARHLGLTHNQYTSLATLAVGVIMFVAMRKLPASAGPTWAQRLEAASQEAQTPPEPKRDKRKR